MPGRPSYEVQHISLTVAHTAFRSLVASPSRSFPAAFRCVHIPLYFKTLGCVRFVEPTPLLLSLHLRPCPCRPMSAGLVYLADSRLQISGACTITRH